MVIRSPTPIRPWLIRLTEEGTNVEAPTASARTFIASATGLNGGIHAATTEAVSSDPDHVARRTLRPAKTLRLTLLLVVVVVVTDVAARHRKSPLRIIAGTRQRSRCPVDDVLRYARLAGIPESRARAVTDAAICSLSVIDDRIAAALQRAGEYQMTIDAVRV